MLIEYSSAQCGAGKTTSLLAELATVPGKYVYAVDRRDVIPARRAMIAEIAEVHGSAPPLVVEIVSEDEKPDTTRLSVSARIDDIPLDYALHDHVIVIVTHRGMTLAQLHTGFSNWEIVIDEDPVLFSHSSVRTPVTGALHAEFFDLLPVPGVEGVSQIVPQPNCPSINDFLHDTYMAGMAEFRRLAEHSGLLTSETDWTNVVAGRGWSYWTLWPLARLDVFARVRIVASEFDQRLNYRIASCLWRDEITFQRFVLAGAPAIWEPRNVLIRFFTDQHRAGSTFFRDTAGKRNLDKIVRWIAAQGYRSEDHYWCANKAYSPPSGVVVPGVRVSSKVAGRNDLRACTTATVLYSAKGSNGEVGAVELLTGGASGGDVIERDREIEDLIQIVMRSSLRDPANTGTVTVNVYDREQAEALKAYLERSGYGCAGRVELRLEVIGTADRSFGKRGRKALPEGMSKTPAERAKAARERQRVQAKASRK